jgi:hypothetical protein
MDWKVTVPCVVENCQEVGAFHQVVQDQRGGLHIIFR